MYYGNVLAGLFAPTIFLHFCLVFPEKRGWFRRRARIFVVYVPARPDLCGLSGCELGSTAHIGRADRAELAAGPRLGGVPGGHLPVRRLGAPPHLPSRARIRSIRQQIKWLRNGARSWAPCPSRWPTPSPTACWAVIPNSYMDAAVLGVRADPDHLGVRHRALPPDGRGHHLPARLRLHPGHHLRAGRLLRPDFLGGRPGGHRSHRGRRPDPDRGLRLPAHPQVDPGNAGPLRLL